MILKLFWWTRKYLTQWDRLVSTGAKYCITGFEFVGLIFRVFFVMIGKYMVSKIGRNINLKHIFFRSWYYTYHRALLPVIPAPYTSCPKWNIILLKTTKNGGNKSNKVVFFFLWGNIESMWKLQICRIISLAVISKRVMGGCVNSDWINAEVCAISQVISLQQLLIPLLINIILLWKRLAMHSI